MIQLNQYYFVIFWKLWGTIKSSDKVSALPLAGEVTWPPNFIQLTASRRALWRQKKDNTRKISIFYPQKLMAMSSYMVNSKYVDPKFPPCEEYLQNSYLAEQASDFYSSPQGSDYQHPAIFSRPNYSEESFSCNHAQGSALQPRGQEPSGPQNHFPAAEEPCPPPVPVSRPCNPQQHPKNGSLSKQPAIVYPWMKKVHVNSGKLHPIAQTLLTGGGSCWKYYLWTFRTWESHYTHHKFLWLKE